MKMYTIEELWDMEEKIKSLEWEAFTAARRAEYPNAADAQYSVAMAYAKAAHLVSELLTQGGQIVNPERPISGWGPGSLEDLEKNVP